MSLSISSPAARQGLWQILPLNPVGMGNSPYSSTSAFAGNFLLVSLERLAERGMIPRGAVAPPSTKPKRPRGLPAGDAGKAATAGAGRRLVSEPCPGARQRERFDHFVADTAWWLEDYVLFEALRLRYQQRSWNTWPKELAHRDPKALEAVRQELHVELDRARFLHSPSLSSGAPCTPTAARGA